MSGPTNALPTAVRLRMKPEGEESGQLDGAWWPHTDDLDAEVVGLIEAIDHRGPRTVRLQYVKGEWTARNRSVQIGAYKVRLDVTSPRQPHLVHLTDPDARVTTLLVVPADTAEPQALAVMARAATSQNRDNPDDLLAATGSGHDSTLQSWDDEGGHAG